MHAPLLADGQLETGRFVVAEWRDEGLTSAERPIAPLHVHYLDEEAWYVVEGALGFVRGAEQLEAGPGSAVLVRRRTPHSYWNADTGLTRYVIVMTPRIAALVEALHRPDASGRADEIFRRHASELLA
jgi:mannose-6-phosphate isomerase-like protein (cupin superfamily)